MWSLGLFGTWRRLGARRVVGVDFGFLHLAEALAQENGVVDRVQFVQGDLHSVVLPFERFDVIVGMVYNNEITTDLAQQQLIAGLVKRFGARGTTVIPNKVRYSATGYDVSSDRGESTQAIEWNTHIENAERQAGVSFGAVRKTLDHAGVPRLSGEALRWPEWWARWWLRRLGRPLPGRNTLGYFDRSRMTALTRPQPFVEIDYAVASAGLEYPTSASLPVIRSGLLKLVIWQQDLLFDDILIRTTESVSVVDKARSVAPGETAILSTGSAWHRYVPLTVRSDLMVRQRRDELVGNLEGPSHGSGVNQITPAIHATAPQVARP
jgi:hypothetical protein